MSALGGQGGVILCATAFFIAVTFSATTSAAGVNYNETTALPLVTSDDVIGQFTSCSGVQYLGADGACHDVSGSGLWTASESDIYYNSGNVGIGTTNPSKPLEVVGTSPQLKLTYGPNNAYYTEFGNNHWNIMPANQSFDIKKDSSVKFRINTDDSISLNPGGGNVGIGTTSPDSKLTVDLAGGGNAHFVTDAASPLVYFERTGSTAAKYGFGIGSGRFNFIDSTNSKYLFYTAYDGFGGLPDLPTLNVGQYEPSNTSVGTPGLLKSMGAGFTGTDTAGGNLYIASGAGRGDGDQSEIRFYTPDKVGTGSAEQAYTAKMVIKGDGKIGIGTTSPDFLLHVNTTTSGYSNFAYLGNDNDGMLFQTNSGVLNMIGYDGSAYNDFSFRTSPTPQLYLDTSGNVGIGTTTPQTLLDVLKAGGGEIRSTDSTTGHTAEFKVTGSNEYVRAAFLLGDEDDNYNNGALWVAPKGTAQETTTLEALTNVDTSNGNTKRSGVRVTPTYGEIYVSKTTGLTGDIPLYFSTQGSSGNYAMTILGDGSDYVGIGTTTPTSLLDVAGDIHLADMTEPGTTTNKLYSVGGALKWNGLNVATGDLTANAISQLDSSVTVTDTGTDGAITFATDNATRMTIDESGNVGIGTASPAYLFDINKGASAAVFHLGSGTHTPTGSLATQAFFFENGGSSNNYSIFQTKTDAGIGLNITNAGNVGVGTASPTKKLHVNGGARFDNTSESDAVELGDGKIYWDTTNSELVIQVN